MFQHYWKFMTRPISDEPTPTALDMAPDYYLHTLYYTIAFVIIMALIPVTYSRLYPTWYKELNERKKSEFPAYLSSMLHHFTVVPLAWIYIYKDFMAVGTNGSVDYTDFLWFAAPFCTGFVLADTIFFAIPLCFRGNFEYIIHHALAIWMIYSILCGSGHLMRFLPHLVICDTTNAVFNVAWLLRLTGYKDSPIVPVLESTFALLFFLLRNINLSLVFGIMFMSPEGQSYGYGRYVFPMISMLQFYWLVKIVQSMTKKMSGGGGAGGKATKSSSARSSKKD